MTRTAIITRKARRLASFATAFGVTAAALVIAAPVSETTAAASDFEESRGFDRAFAPYELPEDHQILTPAERIAAETLSESAPREEEDQSIGGGNASYYGARFAGRRTANGEIFNPRKLTAAHRTLPFGSKVRVTNRRNGRSVVVRINDRGPFARGRVIDLSKAAAQRIGLVRAGHGPVELALLD